MRNTLLVFFSALIVSCSTPRQAGTPTVSTEAVSLLGAPLTPMTLDEDVRAQYTENLKKARADYEANPDDADAIIWLGRRTAYLGHYRKAIGIFSEGSTKHPTDARMYRHRGHRYISVRQLDRAIGDLETAAELISDKKDEVEPDGLPNALNIPTSTLQSNIWYHLGLAYYLTGDLENALRCYRACMKVSKNNDMMVATSHWLYMTLRRMGKMEEAEGTLAPITREMEIIENNSYHNLLLLYKGEISETDLLGGGGDALQSATVAYGVANWHCYNGNVARASQLLNSILDGSYWPAFGYIAAEADLASGRCVEREEQ